jgi:methionine synthase II (cobalamin-independent)
MFGFGIILVHLADYFARRIYDKQRRKNDEEQQVIDRTKHCGKDFGTETELETHIKESHPNNTI